MVQIPGSNAAQGLRQDIAYGTRLFCSPLFELSRIHSTLADEGLIAKHLGDAYRDDKQQRRLFEADQACMAQIHHANVVRFRRLEGDEPVHIIDSSATRSIRQFLDDCERATIRTPLPIAAGLVLDLCYLVRTVEGIERPPETTPPWVELNPHTLLVDDAGRILATHISLQDPPSVTTAVFSREGLPFLVYVAPEQCVRGRDPTCLATRFTLGMVMFELLTGRRLFSAISTGAIEQLNRRKVRGVHPTLSDVDPRLESLNDIVRGLLDPVPEQRLNDIDYIVERVGDLMDISMAATTADRTSFFTEVDTRLSNIAATAQGDSLPPARTSDITELNAS